MKYSNAIILQYQETYLRLQKCFFGFLKRAKTEENKAQFQGLIKEAGKIYEETMARIKNDPRNSNQETDQGLS